MSEAPEIQITKAARAAQLLNDELLVELIGKIRQAQIEIMIASDGAQRDRAHAMIHAIDALKIELVSCVNAGNVARQKLNDKITGLSDKHYGRV